MMSKDDIPKCEVWIARDLVAWSEHVVLGHHYFFKAEIDLIKYSWSRLPYETLASKSRAFAMSSMYCYQHCQVGHTCKVQVRRL